jgi:7-carboxy-7-deazaguanine synthase
VRDFGSQDELVVHELYTSLQGEGTRAGLPCVFVRLTGCGLRCTWCDTEYAFEGGTRRPVAEVVAEVVASGVPLVLLTGGEPLEQPGCLPLARALCDAGLEVTVETGGHVDTGPLDPRAARILDVKCPGSGMAKRNRLENLALIRAQDEVKFVVADRADFDFALALAREHGLDERGCALLFSPVHGSLQAAELSAWLVDAKLPGARLNLQLHKVIWPDRDRGV